jgi:hypothetical protein
MMRRQSAWVFMSVRSSMDAARQPRSFMDRTGAKMKGNAKKR